MFFIKKLLKLDYFSIIKNFQRRCIYTLIFLLQFIINLPYLLFFFYSIRNKKINIILIKSSALGHLLNESFSYLILNKNNNRNNYFYHEDIIANQYLINFLKKKIKINQKLKFVKTFCKLFNIKNINIITLRDYLKKIYKFDVDLDFQPLFYRQSKLKIKFTPQQIDKAKIFLKKYHLNFNSKFVILATRDQNFKKFIHGHSFPHHEKRNFDPKNLKLIIKDLIKKDIKVIRIAQDSKPVNLIKNKNFVDIYNIKKEMDFLYFLLIQRAIFFIGAPSGPLHIAQFFKKKIFCINLIPYNTIFSGYRMVLLPKKIVEKKKILKIKEIFNKNLENYCGYENTKKLQNTKYIENNSTDLFNAYNEFQKILSNASYYNKLKKNNYKILKNSIKEDLFSRYKKTNNVLPASFFKD